MTRLLPALVAAVVGLVWFVRTHSVDALDPTNIGWALVSGDAATHVLGWLAFRQEPWRFPLGAFSTYMHPVGGSVALTDSMPWLAVLFKAFDGWLPTAFQYIGLWLAVCFALQGAAGAWLIHRVGGDRRCQALGGAFFALSPTLLWRTFHETLCAHWLILLLLGLSLPGVAGRRGPGRALLVAFAAVVLAVGLQPYLAAMTWLLAVALAVRLWLHEQAIGPWRAAGFVAGSLAVMGLLGLVFGLLGQGATLQDWGFGRFSADLLTFVNPRGASVVLPTLPTNENQYEGYAYLGVGGLFLAVVAVAAWLRSGQAPARVAPRHVPLIAAAVVMAVLALATPITLLGRPVLDLRAVYAPFAGLTSAFRASGRFIWPLYYLILLVLCTAVVRRLPRPWATATLAVAVLLQVLDVRPIQDRSQSPRAPDVQLWSLGAGHYRHLVLYPPQILWSARCLELGRHPEGYYAPLAYRAYLLGMTINSGYFSRGRLDAFADACTELAERVKRRDFASDTIYVVGAEALASVAGPGMTCGTIDGHNVCVSSAKVTPLERFLGASAGPRPLAHAAPGS